MKLGPLLQFPYKLTRLDGRGGLVSQFFGESQRNYKEVLGTDGHPGLDFAIPNETKIIMPIRMWITENGIDSRGGVYFKGEVVESDILHYELIFVHNKINFVEVGKWVEAGEVVALSDNTGWSSGPHLHFGIRPLIFNPENKVWEKIKNNYKGYIDPLPFFNENGYNYTPKNNMFKLVKLENNNDVWMLGNDNKKHLILNVETYKRGIEIGFWNDAIVIVEQLVMPEGQVIILVNSN